MLLFQIAAVAVVLTTATEAAAIVDIGPALIASGEPVEHTPLVASRKLLQFTAPLAATNITRYTKANTELAVIDERANEGIVVGVLGQSAAVVTAVCAAAAFSALIGTPACIAAGIYAAVAGIWALALASRRQRDFDDIMLNIHANYIPNQDCNVGCRLAASSPHGEWTHFANITSAGIPHSLQYYQSGSYRGIRAISNHQAIPATSKRQEIDIGVEFDQDTDKNWIVSTYWEDDSLAAYNSWNRDDATWAAATTGQYFYDNEAQLGCLDASDSDGIAFESLMLFDWEGEELQLTDDQVSGYLPLCINLEPAEQ